MYQFLIRALAPFILLLTLAEAIKRKGGLRYLKQRLGFGFGPVKTPVSHWIHCASVGEVNAAYALLKELENRGQLSNIVVTTNTPTGAQFLRQKFAQITHCYCPLDWPYAINQFLQSYTPQKLWVLETEIWPNIYRYCHHRDIEITIINGRLSNRTLNAPNFLKRAYQETLTKVSSILTKSEEDKQRFISLGAAADKVQTVGNLKYAQINHLQSYPHPLDSLDRNYVLLASSHSDEELQITKRWLGLNRDELLVIVPRHPKRSADIIKQLQQVNIELAVDSRKDNITDQTQVYLVDKIGALQPLYEHAKLVVMGGSFASKGGHNIIEPCAYGKTVITGPDTANFAEDIELLLEQDAILQCKGYEQLEEFFVKSLEDEKFLTETGNKAQKIVQQKASVLENYVQHLMPKA